MPRVKIAGAHLVKSVADADQALMELAEIRRDRTAIKDAMNADIDALKAQAETHDAPLAARQQILETALSAYAELNKADLFTEKRSLAATYGTMGFRQSTEIKPEPKTTWGMILEKLKSLGFSTAVRVKEDVNREELHNWPDERLKMVGARRVKKDVFWYEVNEAALVSKPAA